MPRTPKCRRICRFPDYYSFIPEDAEKDIIETIELSLDEFETIRLLDYEGLNQEECAARMGVARTTVTAMYENARKKLIAGTLDASGEANCDHHDHEHGEGHSCGHGGCHH